MLLNLVNKISIAQSEIRKGIWDRESNWGMEISGKTIGIIGYGNMGQAFARRISAFTNNILTYDKYKTNYSDEYVQEVSMNELFEKADILSLHIPLTAETKYLVSEQWIQNFKKKFILINTSRGECVNTEALVSALKSKKITGACLDVLEYEKINFENLFLELPKTLEYLIQAPNVVLTPHIAGWTNEAYYKLSKIMAEKVIRNI
jgi:D-3-phosphoglycerate dehydrogenase